MNCEICGREIFKEAVSVRIEGTLMKACRGCARHGEVMHVKKTHSINRPGPSGYQKAAVFPEKTIDVKDDYGTIIRKQREKLGLTQEQLGAKINEKGSVITRLESGHMTPDLKLAKKLERFLGVKLLEELEEQTD